MKVIYKKFPLVQKLIELSLKFKGILLNSKKEKSLCSWFIKAKKLNINNINSFVKGCYSDIDAIFNAIKYDYSNGVVEASVNKIKLVKRIMYGRCSFDLLKSKALRLEFMHNFN